jgi:hypothetical protein
MAAETTATRVATIGGLAAGFGLTYALMGRKNVDVLQLVPLMVLGGLVGHAIGAAWAPTSSGITVNAGGTPATTTVNNQE